MRIHSLAATLLAITTALACTAEVLAQAQPAYGGQWRTESGNLDVEIAPCGDAWCGTVVRVLANRSMAAAGQDMAPADAQPALGLQILRGLRPVDDGVLAGEIYNRENGKTYSVRLSLAGQRQMLVRPYIGLPLFGKTQLWQRSSPGSETMP